MKGEYLFLAFIVVDVQLPIVIELHHELDQNKQSSPNRRLKSMKAYSSLLRKQIASIRPNFAATGSASLCRYSFSSTVSAMLFALTEVVHFSKRKVLALICVYTINIQAK